LFFRLSFFPEVLLILQANNDIDDDDGKNHTIGGFRRLSLKKSRHGVPLSSYGIFGKPAEAPKHWSNPQMEKLGSSVCEHNPLTKVKTGIFFEYTVFFFAYFSRKNIR
jgi:hypothetical protein